MTTPRRPAATIIGLLLLAAAARPTAAAEPLRVFIRAGAPEHYGPGIHDYPAFLASFTTLLRERGATVEGGLQFPGEAELARADVLVLYCHNAGSMSPPERARLETFLGRGGGLVVLHDAIGTDDPEWFRQVVGGAWEHGHSKEYAGLIGLYFPDPQHPITRGVENFELTDELYYDLRMAPGVRVLAHGFHSVFTITPQMWVYEKADYRAFVSLQGHRLASFEAGPWRTLLLRAIAWAGKRDADLLTRPDEVASLPYPAGGALAPERAHESFVHHPDFKLSLVAAEPLVVNPISLEWDPAGRLWVALTPGYPEKAQFSGVPAHDQIVILSDRDGDGRMDSRKVFYDKLDLVSGLVFYQDGVIVASAPDILWLRDTDGDDVADERTVLYTGFGYADTHAVLSNMRWGLDGWIYASQGYSGHTSQITGAKQQKLGFATGIVIRFRPDGSAINTIIQPGTNAWGLDLDWDDEIFYSMANDSHLRHVVLSEAKLTTSLLPEVEPWNDVTDHKELFPLRKEEREPYRQVDYAGGFTAAAGTHIHDGAAWPPELSGNHFVCEPSVNLVHRDVLRPTGITYKASKPRKAEFLASTDLWFRPVHLGSGPDGALYVLDFYNQAVTHDDVRGPEHGPTNAALRPDRDHEHGRIWRMQHQQAVALPRVKLAGASDAELVAALEHPASWQRRTAHRLLGERSPTQLAELARLASSSKSPAARLHALWLLARWDRLEPALLDAALADPAPAVRKNAWRIVGLDAAGGASAVRSAALAKEGDARVRLVALASAGQALAGDEAQAAALLELTPRLDDEWSRSALVYAFAKRPDLLLARALAETDVKLWGPLVAAAAKRLGALRDPHLLERVFVAAAAPKASEALVARALEALEAAWPLDEFPASLPAIEPPLAGLMASDRPRVVMAALPFASRVGTAAGVKEAVERFTRNERELLAKPGAAFARRSEALRTLLALPAERPAALDGAAALLAAASAGGEQTALVAELGAVKEPRVAELLTANFGRLEPKARDAAFKLLSERPEWTLRFLNAVASGTVDRAALGPKRSVSLLNHPDPAVARRAAAVLRSGATAPDAQSDALIGALLPQVSGPGDAAKGRALFEEHCATCHTFRGQGGALGPELTGMGIHGAAALLPSIVDPDRSADPSYHVHVARTRDGRTLSGLLVRDTGEEVVLRHTGGDIAIPRGELESLSSTGRSLMPSGFDEILGAAGLRDLLSYLGSGYEGYRIIDIEPFASGSTWHGLYDSKSDPTRMAFVRYGAVEVNGVPFEILDPLATASGFNAIVLKGGLNEGWESKRRMPQRLEIPIGLPLRRLHVLGGIAGWGFPYTDTREKAVRLTFQYAGGDTEVHLLKDGVEFADWLSRRDVPGSRYAPGLLQEGSRGQLRTFSIAPRRRDVAVASILIESFDNHLAPTFLALTAQPVGAELSPEATQALSDLRGLLGRPDEEPAALAAGRALFEAAAPDIELRLVDELGSSPLPAAAEVLTAAFPALEPAARERAFQELAARPEWSERLLNALATRRISAEELGADRAKRLQEHPEPAVAARAAAILDLLAAPPPAPADATAKFRRLDLSTAVTASTLKGLYDTSSAGLPLELAQRGELDVDGIPFELIDPARAPSGLDAIVLKGGIDPKLDSKRRMPQRVEIPLGFPLERLHVLGGIAGWGFPFQKDEKPIVRWTWRYADGRSETRTLHDGDEFADWIAPTEVPGSELVEGLVKPGSKGQVRSFYLDPSRRDVAVSSLVLESFDNHLAPTFLALTAELHGARRPFWARLWFWAALATTAGVLLWRRRARALP